MADVRFLSLNQAAKRLGMREADARKMLRRKGLVRVLDVDSVRSVERVLESDLEGLGARKPPPKAAPAPQRKMKPRPRALSWDEL